MRGGWLLVVLCVGCGSEDETPLPACISLSGSCAPLYEPRFDEIHARTLLPTCAQGGSSCHSSSGRRGGLTLENIDEAFDGLVAGGRVEPGDASCSELVVRTHQSGHSWSMPPRRPLSAEERCVLRLWVEQGAAR
ncbi:MAG: c-type cytochrome domain-containing protein [Polyangiaceae bacterium]